MKITGIKIGRMIAIALTIIFMFTGKIDLYWGFIALAYLLDIEIKRKK